jgi:hypothetical protein
MNNLYHWHDEVMVNLEMKEFKREMDAIRLLHDASLSNPGLFERTAITIGNALVKLGQHLYRNFTEPHQAYEVTSGKYAA